ncbi:MAG: N-formylglutamate deformylase [Myxococcota bacterium]|jgi:N-formylglutamate deformylase
MNALPYVYIPPDVGPSPLLVSVPHAGIRIADVDKDLIVASERTMLRDADLHVDKLYADAANMGAHFLSCTVSRYVLDVNRSPTDVDDITCPEMNTGATRRATGLIWRESTDGDPVQARALTAAEVQSRIDRVHTPYHAKIDSILNAIHAKFGFAILLDAHSMPSVGRVRHTDTGRPRPHIVPGDNHGKACSPALTEMVVSHFQASDLTVSVNKPYSGGYITRHFGRPEQGFHAIQIELNRALYLHEEVPYWAGAPALELREIINELLPKVMAFRP